MLGDLFVTHNYGRKMQYWLAAKVNLEVRSTQPVTAILSIFFGYNSDCSQE
jgi:hypothetical protein